MRGIPQLLPVILTIGITLNPDPESIYIQKQKLRKVILKVPKRLESAKHTPWFFGILPLN